MMCLCMKKKGDLCVPKALGRRGFVLVLRWVPAASTGLKSSICRSPAQLNCSSGLPFMCLVIWSLLVCWKLRKTHQLTWCHFRRATDFWMSVAPPTNLFAQWSAPNLCSAPSSCCGGPSSMLWLSHQGLNKAETENSYGRTLKIHENTKLHILPLFDMSCHLV